MSHRHRTFFGSSCGLRGWSRGLGLFIGVLGLLVGVLVGAAPRPAAAVATDPLTWSAPEPIAPSGLTGVSCPSTSLCVGVSAGNVYTSTDPAGGAGTWSAPIPVDGTYLADISCPSTSLCVAVGGSGSLVTSTDPTGGASAWSAAVQIDPLGGGVYNNLSSVSCPSTSLCVVGDTGPDVVTSTDPTGGASAWSAPLDLDNIANSFEDVSCPSASLCVAVDDAGNVFTSTNPTGGTSAWSPPVRVDLGLLLRVSCPSTSLCVASDAAGNVVTSTNPTGGAGAWSAPVNVDGMPGRQVGLGVTCASTSLCMAFDDVGNLVTSTNPTGGAGAWRAPRDVDATNPLNDVACPSTSLCLAFDVYGNVLVGTIVPDAADVLIPSNGATLTGTEILDGAATNPFSVSTFQYELTGGSYTNEVVATAKPTIYGWLAQEANGTWAWDSTSVPSGTYTLTAVATYNDGTVVTSPGVSITVSNPAPTAQVLIPSSAATVSGTTFLDGTASYTPNITQFSYDLDGAPVGNAVASPWGWLLLNWNTTTVANGSHTLTAVATYADGAKATSPGVTVTIANP